MGLMSGCGVVYVCLGGGGVIINRQIHVYKIHLEIQSSLTGALTWSQI